MSVGWTDLAQEYLEHPGAVTTAPAYGCRIDALQEMSGVSDLVVASFLRMSSREVQCLRDIAFAHVFEILLARKSVLAKVPSVVRAERIRISDDPRFHCLDHEVDQVGVDAVKIPSISRRQVAGRSRDTDRAFRIHQKYDDTGVPVGARVAEAFVCFLASAATNEPPIPTPCSACLLDFGQKLIHPLA